MTTTVDAYMELVERDLDDDLSPDERAILESDFDRWLLALGTLLQDVEGQFTHRKRVIAEEQKACFKLGDEGSQRWFDAKAEYDDWRHRAAGYKAILVSRIRGVKYRRKKANEEDSRLEDEILLGVFQLEDDGKLIGSPALLSAVQRLKKIRGWSADQIHQDEMRTPND